MDEADDTPRAHSIEVQAGGKIESSGGETTIHETGESGTVINIAGSVISTGADAKAIISWGAGTAHYHIRHSLCHRFLVTSLPFR